MASTIKLKNGSGAPLASDLVAGEPALDLTNKRLYTENSGGTVIEVGTNPTELQVDNINIDGNAITSTDTDGNITITPNGTGEVDISKVDIDSGTIDGTVIGGTTTAAGSFTTLQADTSLNVDGTVTADGLTVDGNIKLDGDGRILQVDKNVSGTDNVLYYDNTVSTNDLYIGRDSSNLRLRTGTQNRLLIDSDGDISFYEDTGTTAKFFWDASAESLGIGTSSPDLDLNIEGSGFFGMHLGQQSDNADFSGRLFFSSTSATSGIVGREGGLGFYTGTNLAGSSTGTERVRIDTSGNVGIGTSSPDHTLDVEADKDTWLARIYNTGSDANAQGLLVRSNATAAHDALALGVYADSGYKMVVRSTGNVGIGTTSPLAKFDVKVDTDKHALLLSSASYSNGADLIATNDGGSEIALGLGGDTIEFYTNATEAMRIDSSGNVGIGTGSSISSDLHLHRSTTGASQIRVTDGATGTTTGDGLVIGVDSSTDAYFWNYENRDVYFGTNNVERMRINQDGSFRWTPDGTNADMTLDASGNVGIGTTSPEFKADFIVDNGDAIAVRPATATLNATQTALRLYGHESVLTSRYVEIASANGAGTNVNNMVFKTGSGTTVAERMRIDSSGNVGIGTSSPASELHVKGEGEILRIESTDATGDCYITFRDSAANKGYIGYGSSSHNDLSIENRESGSDIFFQVGTTEAMRIDENAHVLVGRTAASNVATDNGFNLYKTGQLYIYSSSSGDSDVIRGYDSSGANTFAIDGDGDYIDLSDQRKKENIADIEIGLTEVMQLQPRKFDWIASGEHVASGFIAQEVQSIIPSAVVENDDGFLMMKQKQLIPVLTKALQEQQALIESLTARIEALEGN